MSRAEKDNPTKRLLGRIEYYNVQINNKIDERETVKSLVLRVTSSMNLAPGGGGGGDRIGDGVAKLVALEKEINAAIDRFVDLRRQITDAIERLENPDEIATLHMKYVGRQNKETGITQYLTFEQIADELHMTKRNVCYIHGRALQKVARMHEKVREKDQ